VAGVAADSQIHEHSIVLMEKKFDPILIKGIPFVSWLWGFFALILWATAGWFFVEANQQKEYLTTAGAILEIKVEYRERSWLESFGDLFTGSKSSDKPHEYAHIGYGVNTQKFQLQKPTASGDTIGRKITVHYDPQDPSKASTDSVDDQKYLAGLTFKIGIGFWLMAVVLGARAIWKSKKVVN
jgi:hypothetical protein